MWIYCSTLTWLLKDSECTLKVNYNPLLFSHVPSAFYQEDNLHRHMASHDTDSETSQDPRDEASPKNDENVVRNVIYSEDAPLKIRIPKKFVDFVASPVKKKEETTFGKK